MAKQVEMHKGGKKCVADEKQIALMEKAGWKVKGASKAAPEPEAATEEDKGSGK